MRTSISLQRSLFQHQQAQIERTVAGASAAFRRYERRYQRATRHFRAPISLTEVHRRVVDADVVFVGDYHTLKLAQQAYLDLVHAALASRRRVVLALEVVEGRHQKTLDAFLAGKIAEKTFLSRIGHPYRGAFDIWPNFRPIFELARAKGLDLVAIDRRAKGSRSLEVRDGYAARRIAQAAAAEDRPIVLALMGQFHVAPMHLPAAVERALRGVERRSLVVYQNAESVYWRLAERGLAGRTAAVELRAHELCLVNASPVVCQRSFLDYVEAENGDAPLDESGIAGTFRRLAKDIGRLAGVPVGSRADEVEIATAADLSPIDRITRRARFTGAELAALRKHVLSRESAWIPRARVVWLASLSLNHAAEEAAHFVRHVAVGDAMDRPRTRAQAFWARCLEEALGFFGSRLVNSARPCVQPEEWLSLFHHGTAEQKRIAAFVLALSSVEAEASSRFLPLSSPTLFHGVSHALGYLLGDALAQAFEAGRISRSVIRALFHDPFDDPAHTYRLLADRLRPAAKRSRRRSSLRPTAELHAPIAA